MTRFWSFEETRRNGNDISRFRVEVAGSNPASPTTAESAPLSDFVNFFIWLRKQRTTKGLLAESTVEGKMQVIRHLTKKANLYDAEMVQQYIDEAKVSNGRKQKLEYSYRDWCRFKGVEYKPRTWVSESPLPYVPLETDIDQLISGWRSKYQPYLQLLKETGFRPGEALTLTPMDFDFNTRTVTLNKPEKHSKPRQMKISDKLISMLMPLVRKTKPNERIWKAEEKSVRSKFAQARRRISERLGNPNIARIPLKNFRHWKGSMEYHRTKDILYVKELLGHKNIKNTLIYTHLVNFESDEWTCRVASTLEEIAKLVEAGFEYVTEMDSVKIFRKRK